MRGTHGSVLQESVYGDLYYVSASRLSCAPGKSGGPTRCRLEFRRCIKRKARRTCLVLAFMGVIDSVVSFLIIEYNVVLQFLFIAILVLYLIFSAVLSTYKEVVLVVQGFGVQISSTNWLGYTSSVFLPHTIVGDIIINEGITMCRVVFYLAVMVVRDKTEPQPHVVKLYPLFTDFNPRLSVIEEAYHLLRSCLEMSPTTTTDSTDRTESTAATKDTNETNYIDTTNRKNTLDPPKPAHVDHDS